MRWCCFSPQSGVSMFRGRMHRLLFVMAVFKCSLNVSSFMLVLPPPLPFLPPSTMSGSDQTMCPSTTDNFTAILKTASNEYRRVTGQNLDTHPFASQLDICHSPEAVSKLLRTQAQAFSKFRQSEDKLMAWLDHTVHILFTVSATLSDGIGPVSLFLRFLCVLSPTPVS